MRASGICCDLVVEAGHALHRLPPDEVRLRLGVNGGVLDEVIRGWVTGEPSRDVAEVELIRACWFEALDFFLEQRLRDADGLGEG